MAVSMYRISVPVFVRGLKIAATLLQKAEEHAAQHGVVPEVLLSARLADDMLPLSAQVQRASDTSKASAERLSGVAAPRFPDNEASFAQLQERIANTIAYLESLPAAAFDGAESREIVLNAGSLTQTFTGEDYQLVFGLPNFYFHLTTLHDILRNQGVKVGKMDFLGKFAE